MDTEGTIEVTTTHKQANYFGVFVVLGVITAVMVGIEVFHIDITPFVRNTLFIVLSVFKATLVAMYYMHLKFDSRIYTIMFVIPVFFVLVLVVILLL